MRRFATALLAVLLLLQAVGICASAAEDAVYQVRVYAGNVGATINGGSVWTFTGHYGDPIPFDAGMVSLPEGSKYYVKGVRESGLDNDMVSPLGTVREDADYVVAYGIKGKLVSYTVVFVDESGKELRAPQTYVGNAGDKPVVSFLYVDGYQPQAYNLTKTLSENEGSNVFKFVYKAIVRPTPVPTPEPTAAPTTAPTEAPAATNAPAATTAPAAPVAPTATAAPGTQTQTTEPTAAPAAGTEPTAAPGEENAEATAAPEAEEAEATEAPAEEGAEATETPTEAPTPTAVPDEPQEIIDLDEGDTPLGNAPETAVEEQKTDLQKLRVEAEAKFFVSTGMVAVALVALVTATYLLLRKHGIRH